MLYEKLLRDNLDEILKRTRQEILNDNELQSYVRNDEELDKLLVDKFKILQDYLMFLDQSNQGEVEHFCWHFYKEITIPYSLTYKSLYTLKKNFIEVIHDQLQTKEAIIEINTYFDGLINSISKVYIKKDISVLKDLKTNVYSKYLLIRAHEQWVKDLVKAIAEDDLENFPFNSAKECDFHGYLQYPESMMVCLDVNLCHLLHNMHELIHKTANSFYLFYKRNDFTQAYIVFKELLETILKFNKIVTELYILAYADAEETFFKFIEILLSQKDITLNITMINIKRLKTLNKNFGERNIDKLIAQFDQELFTLVQQNEEKMLLIKGTTTDYYMLDFGYVDEQGLENFAQELYKIVNRAYEIDTNIVDIESTVVSLNLNGFYGKNRTDLTKLMFHLKEQASGLNHSLVIDKQVHKEEQLKWLEKEYRDVHFIGKKLDEGAVDVIFQPIFNTKTGEVEILEALARIVNDDGSLIPAGVFIETIYQMDRIEELDRLVLKKIQSYKKELHIIAKTLFINISYQSLTDKFYKKEFKNFMESFIDEDVVFELTEQVIVENVKEIIDLYNEYDVHFAVDDFGSGYSSLKTVSDLARNGLLKILKIDETLVKNLNKDIFDRKIVNVISQLSTALDLSSVGEFIENKEVLEQLQAFGVTYAQGYYLSKPKRIEELVVAKLNDSLQFEFE